MENVNITLTAEQALAIAAVLRFVEEVDGEMHQELVAYAKESYPGIQEESVAKLRAWAENDDETFAINAFKTIVDFIVKG